VNGFGVETGKSVFLFLGILLSSPSITPCLAHEPMFRDGSASLVVRPEHIEVTSFYHGSTVMVDIVAPSECQIALKLEGDRKTAIFRQKGKVGILWMNVGDVTVKNAPLVYMLYTSAPLPELAPPATLQRLRLGYDALDRTLEFEGENMDRESMLSEFKDFQETRGLYRTLCGSLRGESYNEDQKHYSIQIPMPSAVPVGAYGVELFVFNDGVLTDKLETIVSIEKNGLPRFVSRLAREHAADYGFLAIVTAVVAGFFIGVAFNYVGRRSR
jgi:uncharacterized protein (TIGR02186 family)